jgi:hypothetical protein
MRSRACSLTFHCFRQLAELLARVVGGGRARHLDDALGGDKLRLVENARLAHLLA